MNHPCEAKCGRYFNSIKSMNLHLTSAKSCSWFTIARLRDLGVNDMEDAEDFQVHQHVGEREWQEYDPQQDPDVAMEFGPYEDELQFLRVEAKEISEENQPQTAEKTISHHSKHTVLDDEEDERIIIVDEDAGRIFRKEPPPSYTQDRDGDELMEEDGEPNPFAPFSSELDWRVAHWAVKDGPGHNAFNRFLEIPGVSNLDEISLSHFKII